MAHWQNHMDTSFIGDWWLDEHLRVGGVDVMDGHAALNAAQGEARWLVLLVFEYGHTAVLQEKQLLSH